MKTWILFFDENGENRCGSEWSHAMNCGVVQAQRKILSKEYFKPKEAVGYLALTHYEFMNYTYDDFKRMYQNYGKKIYR